MRRVIHFNELDNGFDDEIIIDWPLENEGIGSGLFAKIIHHFMKHSKTIIWETIWWVVRKNIIFEFELIHSLHFGGSGLCSNFSFLISVWYRNQCCLKQSNLKREFKHFISHGKRRILVFSFVSLAKFVFPYFQSDMWELCMSNVTAYSIQRVWY